jgi:hypothetical protein
MSQDNNSIIDDNGKKLLIPIREDLTSGCAWILPENNKEFTGKNKKKDYLKNISKTLTFENLRKDIICIGRGRVNKLQARST